MQVKSFINLEKGSMATSRAPSTTVKFTDNNANSATTEDPSVNQNEQRTKFLTMKYGQNEIKLIQKRLKIEFWMDAELKQLFEVDVSWVIL